jgi:hypothetical protein
MEFGEPGRVTAVPAVLVEMVIGINEVLELSPPVT